MMMQPSTTMTKIMEFLSYLVFDELHYLQKPSRNLKSLQVSPLSSNLFILQGKTTKSESIV